MVAFPFTNKITSEAELRTLMGEPSELVIRKQLSALDAHCQAFIALSPFLLIGTVGADGLGDVSPRGDPPGFVHVVDEKTLLIPDRPGNRRIDSLRNILQTGAIGLLFIAPNVGETLRINGRACLIRDDVWLARMALQGKQPQVAIAVTVEECYLQCGKALKRSRLWQPEHWPARDALPSLAQMLIDQVKPADTTVEQLEGYIKESYTQRLY